MLGYDKPLFILAFDHRSSFLKGMFRVSNREPTAEEVQKVKDTKWMIYEAFLKVAGNQIPREDAAILVDEQFGETVLQDAEQKGYTTILTTEKSGQEEFIFEYGKDFGEHIKKFRPTFAKALIRYNPEADRSINERQRKSLKILSDFCHTHGFKFLIEPLIPATQTQLEQTGNDQHRFDTELRPRLAVLMMRELQSAGVEPDIWKIEGMETASDYEHVVSQARSGGRNTVGIVILGRGASEEQVEQWIRAGRSVNGVRGFAVGRTLFWNALISFYRGEQTRDQAITQITHNYVRLYQIFTNTQ